MLKKIIYKLIIKEKKFFNLCYFNNFKINHFLKLTVTVLLLIIFLETLYKDAPLKYELELNQNYLKTQLNLNLSFNNKIKNKIKVAIYYTSIKNGGIERLSALLMNYLDKVKIFNTYLLTQQPKDENEYQINKNTKRIIINLKRKNYLINVINRYKIDIIIYHFYEHLEIQALNGLKNTKTILYNHSCFFIWIYAQLYFYFNNTYNIYKNSKYIISLVPFENDYLFKKWGIKSILMNNFITYEYNSVIPSDLSSKTILMIGRGSDRMKRFELGVEAMKYIIKEIPKCKMKIISKYYYIDYLIQMIKDLKLEENIEFVGYNSNPEIYFKNASLHIFPSISESFGLVLSETKIFGIPNILVGLDYVSISKGGTVIIYDDKSHTIAKEAIKILKNKKYRKELGKEARKSMKKFKNELLLKKWIKLILCIYNGDIYYQKLRNNYKKLSKNESINILSNQIKLLKRRIPKFKNITLNNIENFTFMRNIN